MGGVIFVINTEDIWKRRKIFCHLKLKKIFQFFLLFDRYNHKIKAYLGPKKHCELSVRNKTPNVFRHLISSDQCQNVRQNKEKTFSLCRVRYAHLTWFDTTFPFTHLHDRNAHPMKSILNLKQKISLHFLDSLCVSDRQE